MTSRLHMNERRVTPPLDEVERWRQFVDLLLPLVQTGRIDAAGADRVSDALGRPANIERAYRVLFDIAQGS